VQLDDIISFEVPREMSVSFEKLFQAFTMSMINCFKDLNAILIKTVNDNTLCYSKIMDNFKVAAGLKQIVNSCLLTPCLKLIRFAYKRTENFNSFCWPIGKKKIVKLVSA